MRKHPLPCYMSPNRLRSLVQSIVYCPHPRPNCVLSSGFEQPWPDQSLWFAHSRRCLRERLAGCMSVWCWTAIENNPILLWDPRELHYSSGGSGGLQRHQIAGGGVSMPCEAVEHIRTRSNLSAYGWFAMYSVKSPPNIQSETSRRGSMVAPRKGTIFGCTKCFHTAATR